MEAAGPVFCAGITMFSPLNNWKANAGGKRVGIVGIGGLGQMGIRLAKAMGNTVVAISSSPNKKEAAMELGADEFVVSKDPESLKTVEKSLDLILNTVSADHDITTYLQLLARNSHESQKNPFVLDSSFPLKNIFPNLLNKYNSIHSF